MAIIFILSALLVLFAAWFMTRPVGGRAAMEEDRIALELTRDETLKQLREIDSDRQDGRIDDAVAVEEKGRLEYELAKVLKALEAIGAPKTQSVALGLRHRGWVALLLVALLPVAAGGMDYWQNKPALLTFAALNSKGQLKGVHGFPPMVLSMVAKLKRHLVAHPHDTQGWLALARANVVLGDMKGARVAYTHAYKLAPHDANVLANYAWLLYTAHPTQTTGMVDTLYRQLYAQNPKQQDALWFLGLAAYNKGHFRHTLTYWQRLESELPPGSKAYAGVAKAVSEVRTRLQPPAVQPAIPAAPEAGTTSGSQSGLP